jgi:hypothetical protein
VDRVSKVIETLKKFGRQERSVSVEPAYFHLVSITRAGLPSICEVSCNDSPDSVDSQGVSSYRGDPFMVQFHGRRLGLDHAKPYPSNSSNRIDLGCAEDEVEDHSEDSLQVAFRLGNSPWPPGALRHNKESDPKPFLAAML